MHSEIGFIFSPSLGGFNNNNNTSNIYQKAIKISPPKTDRNTSQGQETPTNRGNTTQNPVVTNPPLAVDTGVLVYKGARGFGTEAIKNYLIKDTYRGDDSNEDPYIALINYFAKSKSTALKLKAGDFAYLKDLGVYPINRLWILRRFPDNAIVPNNLLAWGSAVQPVSTVIGWMKDKEDNPLLSVSFSEVWTDQTQMIDKVLAQILKDNFGFKLDAVMPVPGWSQGLLFGMLNAMGLTDDYNAMNVPTGDPNVLRVAKMREIENQGLKSSISLSLETSYEQKYINGIDPGLAMQDVLSNLFRMGTSDQRFILSNSPMLQQLIGNINGNKNVDAWLTFVKDLIKKFLNGVVTFIKAMVSESSDITAAATQTTNDALAASTGNADTGTTSANAPEQLTVVGTGGLVSNVANSLLAGTIAKYRWPLKGSIAMMSGINTTPWHLTIGNPYSPIINIGNVFVSNVDVKLSNELGFNDMPARIDVSVSAEFGRPLGKQELEKMFNNGYKRVYSNADPSFRETTDVNNSITTASGVSATSNVSKKESQPVDTKTLIDRSVYTGGV